MHWSPRDLARHIDHTLLKPEAGAADIARLCAEALEHRFWSVCVHGSRVAQAAALLEGSDVQVAAVVGFPLGAMDGDAKRYETEVAIDLGAQEIDMVLNIGRLKDGDDRAVFREIRDVVEAAQGIWVKVILETCFLTLDQVAVASRIAEEAGADMVKTSTGFGSAGATPEAVRVMLDTVGGRLGVKASGGIRSWADCVRYLDMGCARIGVGAAADILDQAP